MNIEMGKKYRYRNRTNNSRATILTTERPDPDMPIVAMDEAGIITTHRTDGGYLMRSEEHDLDLVEDIPTAVYWGVLWRGTYTPDDLHVTTGTCPAEALVAAKKHDKTLGVLKITVPGDGSDPTFEYTRKEDL